MKADIGLGDSRLTSIHILITLALMTGCAGPAPVVPQSGTAPAAPAASDAGEVPVAVHALDVAVVVGGKPLGGYTLAVYDPLTQTELPTGGTPTGDRPSVVATAPLQTDDLGQCRLWLANVGPDTALRVVATGEGRVLETTVRRADGSFSRLYRNLATEGPIRIDIPSTVRSRLVESLITASRHLTERARNEVLQAAEQQLQQLEEQVSAVLATTPALGDELIRQAEAGNPLPNDSAIDRMLREANLAPQITELVQASMNAIAEASADPVNVVSTPAAASTTTFVGSNVAIQVDPRGTVTETKPPVVSAPPSNRDVPPLATGISIVLRYQLEALR